MLNFYFRIFRISITSCKPRLSSAITLRMIVVMNLLQQSRFQDKRFRRILPWRENSGTVCTRLIALFGRGKYHLRRENVVAVDTKYKRITRQDLRQVLTPRLRTLLVAFTACVNLAFTMAVNSPRSSEYGGGPSRL